MGHLKIIAIGLGIVLATPTALACSCMRFESAQQQLDTADLVFEGQVINVTREKDRRSFWQRLKGERAVRRDVTTFQVYQTFKGDAGNTVALTHLGGDRSAACGIDFKQTEPFVVLAYESSDGTYSSSLCTQAQFGIDAFREASEVSASE